MCDCVKNNLLIQSVVVIFLILIIYYIYGLLQVQSEMLTAMRDTAEGGYLSSFLPPSNSAENYVGYPLVNSVNDSGADLRRLGTQFTSTDQGSEKFKNVAKLYK